MIEKVNPSHPDKIADRIAGAIVDIAYKKECDPKIAVEVLIGHGTCHAIIETNVDLDRSTIETAIRRIAGNIESDIVIVQQDEHLSKNQSCGFRCGDNGIFKGVPITEEQMKLSRIARELYARFPCDGKYIIGNNCLVICQSNASTDVIKKIYPSAKINPIGDWVGGTDVDTGATNRKLGSDMADSVTGGGLHGKDLSKADVSINIYAFIKAQKTNRTVEISCAIGDSFIDDGDSIIDYADIVKFAKGYIIRCGGFEKFAEWGLF